VKKPSWLQLPFSRTFAGGNRPARDGSKSVTRFNVSICYKAVRVLRVKRAKQFEPQHAVIAHEWLGAPHNVALPQTCGLRGPMLGPSERKPSTSLS